VESAIAAVHAQSPSAEGTDWDEIVSLYDVLMRIQPSPVVAFNRAVALAQRDGSARGLEEIERIKDRKRLKRYPFYYAAVAEFELQLGRPAEARDSFAQALKLARNPAERRFLQEKMSNLALLERH
jgi:RNA polymerase sigma-70 factor (ECF subfamily)